MDAFFTDYKKMFHKYNIVTKLIIINLVVFIVLRLGSVLATLFNLDVVSLLQALEVPSSLHLLVLRPWTLFTYMFAHYDVWHILFNMLWLYWFGQLFLYFFIPRQFVGVYLLGGLSGALLFILAYNTFPYFASITESSYLMGASASVMAIVFAVAFYKRDYEISLFLVGRIKLIYLALFTVLLDLLMLTSSNAGGHIAHIGGALFGIYFANRMQRGYDKTAWLNRILDKIANWFKPKPKMKVTHRRNETDLEYNTRKRSESEEVDRILDKLKKSGYDSLTAEERRKLFDASKK